MPSFLVELFDYVGGRLVNADVHERAIRGGQVSSCENPRETESPGHVLDPHQRECMRWRESWFLSCSDET